MADMAMGIGGNLGCKGKMPVKHIPGPEGVRGRNSNNDLIKEVLGWAPSITLQQGLEKTAPWILNEIKKAEASGKKEDYAHSKVVAAEAVSKIGETKI